MKDRVGYCDHCALAQICEAQTIADLAQSIPHDTRSYTRSIEVVDPSLGMIESLAMEGFALASETNDYNSGCKEAAALREKNSCPRPLLGPRRQ